MGEPGGVRLDAKYVEEIRAHHLAEFEKINSFDDWQSFKAWYDAFAQNIQEFNEGVLGSNYQKQVVLPDPIKRKKIMVADMEVVLSLFQRGKGYHFDAFSKDQRFLPQLLKQRS